MPIAHARLRIAGHLYGQDELWSVGLNFVPGGGPVTGDPDEDLIALTAWRDKVRALNGGNVVPNGLRELLSTAGTISYLRCSTLGVDGKERAVAELEFAAPVPGLTAPSMPPQVALSVQLATGRPGSSYRGRFYWPAIGADIGPTGRLDPSFCQGAANQLGPWIAALGDAGDTFANSLVPVVVSDARGAATPITTVRVGDRLDIQRRRADSQKEAYGSALVPQ